MARTIFSYERFERRNTATEREEMEYRVEEREVKNLVQRSDAGADE